jgi:hypothetical protein
MLLLYAIENDIVLYIFEDSTTVLDFSFATLKTQAPLYIRSYNEMCPKCEGLFEQYLSRRPQQHFAILCLNEQSSRKKRTFVSEKQLENFFKMCVPK